MRNGTSMFALGRLKRGAMNKTELAYSEHLEELRRQGRIIWFKFEALKLRLADNTFYTPDVLVLTAENELQCHEVKGYWMDDARVKIKVAADTFPLEFIAVKALPKKDGGGWSREQF